jgi:ABC-type multidrug transport system permease subunit
MAAVCVKDLRLALRERVFTIIGLVIPINFLFLFILFALTGGLAPTAVVMRDQGPLAEQLLSAMEHAHSFRITVLDGADAERELREGSLVAVVTVPASFDDDLRAGRQVRLPVEVNNLNVDFTNDIRRAVPLSITSFYGHAFPEQVVVTAREIDRYGSDTDYVPYLAVSIVVAGFFLEGLLQASVLSAREYEDGTIKEMLLAPASPWAIALGKVAAGLVVTAVAGALVTLLVVFGLGVHPVHPWEVLGAGLLLMVPFVAIGVLVGTLLKRRQSAIPLAIATFLPLFFLSGPFGPPNWLGAAANALSLVSPLTYAIALFQHAFHGYQTAQVGPGASAVVLAGFAVLALGATALVLRRGEVS